MANHLRKIPAFANLPDGPVEQLVSKLEKRTALNHIILKEGNSIQELCYILRGEVEVHTAHEGVIAVLYGGDSFGEEILQGEKYASQATFRARGAVTYYALGRDMFLEVRGHFPSLGDQLTTYPRYSWLKPGERVVSVSSRSIAPLFWMLCRLWLAAAIVSGLLLVLFRQLLLSVGVFVVLMGFIICFGYIRLNAWRRRSYVLTNTRISEDDKTKAHEPYVAIPLKYVEAVNASGSSFRNKLWAKIHERLPQIDLTRSSLKIELKPPAKPVFLADLVGAKNFASAATEAAYHARLFRESDREQLIDKILSRGYHAAGQGPEIREEAEGMIIGTEKRWKPHWLPFVARWVVYAMIIILVAMFFLRQSAYLTCVPVAAGAVLFLLGLWQHQAWDGREYVLSSADVSRRERWAFSSYDFLRNNIKLDEISEISLDTRPGDLVQWLAKYIPQKMLGKLSEVLDIGSIVFEKQRDYEYGGQKLLFADVGNPRKVYFEVLEAVYDRLEKQWVETRSPELKAIGRRLMPEPQIPGAGDSLKILVAIPYPIAEEGLVRDLQVEVEWNRVLKALRDNSFPAHVTRLRPPTLYSLGDAIDQGVLDQEASGQSSSKWPYDVMHIIGHGSPEEIQFELEWGALDKVSGKQLAAAMGGRSEKPDVAERDPGLGLVVLNVCRSKLIGKILIDYGVAKSVLCMENPIDDDVSISLTQHLYQYLGGGKSVQEAVRATRNRLAEEFDVNEARNVELLLYKDLLGPLYLFEPSPSQYLVVKDGLPEVFCLKPDEPLTRESILVDIAMDLREVRCLAVLLFGGNQSRRTQLARETGMRLCWQFKGGVVYVDCKGLSSFNGLRDEILVQSGHQSPERFARGARLLILDRLDDISSIDEQRIELENYFRQLAPDRGDRVIITTEKDVQVWEPNGGFLKLRVGD